MCLTIDELRGLCTPDNIYLTLHASKRLEQRGILIDDVISCIMTGEIIEEYPNDYPYPSCLTLGNLNTKMSITCCSRFQSRTALDYHRILPVFRQMGVRFKNKKGELIL